MASTLELLRQLVEAGVEFVLVGGMAAAAHGSSLVTEDVDLCVPFELENLDRILKCLQPLSPKMRMSPHRPPLTKDAQVLVGWKNLYVVSDAGQVDFLSAVTGVGLYSDVLKGAVPMDLGGFTCRVMGLEDLIRAKRALGRPKDLLAAAELEELQLRISNKSN